MRSEYIRPSCARRTANGDSAYAAPATSPARRPKRRVTAQASRASVPRSKSTDSSPERRHAVRCHHSPQVEEQIVEGRRVVVEGAAGGDRGERPRRHPQAHQLVEPQAAVGQADEAQGRARRPAAPAATATAATRRAAHGTVSGPLMTLRGRARSTTRRRCPRRGRDRPPEARLPSGGRADGRQVRLGGRGDRRPAADEEARQTLEHPAAGQQQVEDGLRAEPDAPVGRPPPPQQPRCRRRQRQHRHHLQPLPRIGGRVEEPRREARQRRGGVAPQVDGELARRHRRGPARWWRAIPPAAARSPAPRPAGARPARRRRASRVSQSAAKSTTPTGRTRAANPKRRPARRAEATAGADAADAEAGAEAGAVPRRVPARPLSARRHASSPARARATNGPSDMAVAVKAIQDGVRTANSATAAGATPSRWSNAAALAAPASPPPAPPPVAATSAASRPGRRVAGSPVPGGGQRRAAQRARPAAGAARRPARRPRPAHRAPRPSTGPQRRRHQ